MRSLILLLLISTALARFECDEELKRERKADTAVHDCRECNVIPMNAEENCPKMNYDCEEDLILTANVLHVDECSCSQLQCRDANSTLAVAGDIVRKVRCKDRVWTAPPNITAASATCARRCDLGICPVLPADFFLGQDILGPLTVSPPDQEHPCAWADCTIGAIAQQESTEIVYKGNSSFSCTGNTLWKYTGPGPVERRLHDVACIIKDCEKLPYGVGSLMCVSKYACYEPDFVDGTGEVWKKMTCPVEGALRFSADDAMATPTCKIGQWSEAGNNIVDTTEVVCVTCPNVITEPLDDVEADVSENNKEVTCSDGQLTIEFEDEGTQQVPVDTLTCTPTFAWTSTGGTFPFPFSSLEEVVNQGITWKARCISAAPKVCKTLPVRNDYPYCEVPDVFIDTVRYDCSILPQFVWAGDYTMECATAKQLRYGNDVTTIVNPTCLNGQWKVDGQNIEDTTEVVCIRCRILQYTNDPDRWRYNHPTNPSWIYCENDKPMSIHLTRKVAGGNEYTGQIIPITGLNCNQDTFVWESVNGDFSPYPFASFAEMLNQGQEYVIRCIDP